jgi:hypothetical protein
VRLAEVPLWGRFRSVSVKCQDTWMKGKPWPGAPDQVKCKREVDGFIDRWSPDAPVEVVK